MRRWKGKLLFGLILVGVGVWSQLLSGSYPLTWDPARKAYYIDMPMLGGFPPDLGTTGGFRNHEQNKWIVGANNSGSGTWSFILPNKAAFGEVTFEVTVYDRGQDAWAGGHESYFGTDPAAIDQLVGSCAWNDVPAGGGTKTYSRTFACQNFETIVYFRHVMTNGWGYDTAQQLLSVKIAVTPAPAWRRLGLDGGGYVRVLALGAANPNRVYCGSDVGGIHRSTDGGQTWSIATTGFDRETYYHVAGLLVDDLNPGRVFSAAGTGNSGSAFWWIKGGVCRSTDGGQTWTKPANEYQFGFSGEGTGKFAGHVLEFDPVDHNIIYAASWNDGLWKSSDAGISWSQIGLNDRWLTGVWVDPDDRTRMLVAARTDNMSVTGGVYESRNSGQTWTKILDNQGVVSSISRSAADHNRLAAACNGNQVRISTNRGMTWTGISLHPSCTVVQKVVYEPGTSQKLWVAGGNRGLFHTTTDGAGWTWPTQNDTAFTWPGDWFMSRRPSPMEALSDLLIDPANPSRMYACDYYTTWLSTNGGTTWTPQPYGLNVMCVYQLVCDPSQPDVVYALCADEGLLKSTDGGATFAWPENPGAVTWNEIHQLWINPSNSNHLICTRTIDWMTPHQVHVCVSRDGGVSWTAYSSGLPCNGGGYLTGLAVLDSAGTDIMVAWSGSGSVNGGVYRSTNGGSTWTRRSSGLPDNSSLFGSGSDALPNLVRSGNMVYAATSQGLYRCDKSVSNPAWTQMGSGTLPDNYLATLAVDSHSPNTIWVGTAGSGLFVSTDQGQTWAQKGTAAMQYCQGVAIDPDNSSRWAVAVPSRWWSDPASVAGVYLTEDNGTTWTRSADMPCNGLAWRVTFDPHHRGVVLVGANGAGAWKGRVSR